MFYLLTIGVCPIYILLSVISNFIYLYLSESFILLYRLVKNFLYNMATYVNRANYWERKKTFCVLKDDKMNKTKVLITNSIWNYINL